MRILLVAAALCQAVPVLAQAVPPQTAAAALAAAPAGTRFGLLVVDDQGREIAAIRPDDRFIPASNTKLFTTAAALAVLGANPPAAGARIGLAQGHGKVPDVVIAADGSLSLSTAADCVTACLAPLLDQVAAQARTVGDVIADASAFSDQRWSPGMSWNNIGTDSGTATAALAIDHNELPILVTPAAAGQPPVVTVSPYFTVLNQAVTVTEGETRLGIDRAVGSRTLRIYGTIKAGAPWRELLGLDDPADFAGWLVAKELAARGVKVRGRVKTIFRPVGAAPAAPAYRLGFAATAPAKPLEDEVRLINKVSQNLHAEMLVRRLAPAAPAPEAGKAAPVDSLEQGLAAARAVLVQAGVPRAGFDFADGSGMSTYNRVSPRAAVALLRWTAGQPWGAAYRASLPVGGVDGTLRRRFAGTPLAGRIFAKTGTLNATNALSGWLIAASGRELTFSIIANDVPDGTSALRAMDRALVAIAAAN